MNNSHIFVMDLHKALQTVNKDGDVSRIGLEILQQYALKWVYAFIRDFDLEELYPELTGLFDDIRADFEYALYHASPKYEG